MGQTSETIENSCRLCDESCTSMHSVFERSPEGQQILYLIKDCLRLLIYRKDPLPKYICESCYSSLLNFSSFKRISHETLERHKEKLQEKGLSNTSVKLFLSALEQDNSKVNDNHNTNNSQKIIVGTNYLQENIENESILCAELQKALNDTRHKSKIQENHITNGDIESQDEDSYINSPFKGFPASDSPLSVLQNTESQSDMELCESDNESTPKIITANITGKRVFSEVNGQESPVVKRRRFVGPKSQIKILKEKYMRLLQSRESKLITKKCVKYNPLSLMRCIVNHINKTQIPDYKCDHYTTVEVDSVIDMPVVNGNDIDICEENICNYCEQLFMDTNSLAVHERDHMYVVLGQKVDIPYMWSNKELDAELRNHWYKSSRDCNTEEPVREIKKTKELVNFDDCSGRVNVIDPEDVEFKDKEEEVEEDEDAEANNDHQALLVPKEIPLKAEVVLIDTKATVNGVPLSEIRKDERRTLYRCVTVNGVRRKFCPLCRYTFKDNWAIESHYFSSACHYTCRFCGVRFNKQRNEFDQHVKQHILGGDQRTTKVFASRKFNSNPKIVDESRIKAQINPTPRRSYNSFRFNPINMKKMYSENSPQIKLEPRSESSSPAHTRESIKSEGKPQNQAYFCRKCYQVFFKLDEFNVHVVTCRGTGFANTKIATPNARSFNSVTVKKEPERPEKISSSGRPVRNCVREIGTYADDVQEEIETPPPTPHHYKQSPLKSARGYECGLCSSCFPTVHSRNSHMRIHKAQLHALSNKSISIMKNKPENVPKKIIKMESQGVHNNYANVKIKQEPIEPIVEIHEQPHANNYPSSIGAVSITPLPNASQKAKLDPSIMKLVQNNPNLTIKSMAESKTKTPYFNHSSNIPSSFNHSPQTPSNENPDGEIKCYRCLSCSKPFANKSNLYFHKKNHCSGSKYPCPFCKKRFGTEAAYSSHIFYNHPE